MSSPGPFTFRFLEEFGVPLARVRAGERLFTVGEPGAKMYLVIEGKIDIAVGGRIVETVGMHGILGEMALLDNEPRSATAAASQNGEVAIIDRDTFFDLVREEPSFALYVMSVMAKRIRRMNLD